MIIFDYTYKIIYLYLDIFDNNFYINIILLKFYSYKLLADIYHNKVLGSKVYINLVYT